MKKCLKKMLKKIQLKKHEHRFETYPNIGVRQCADCEEIQFIQKPTRIFKR